MKKNLSFIISVIWMLMGLPTVLFCQMDKLHGDEDHVYRGWHSGNQIRTTFYNDGMIGHRRVINPDDIYGEWPINQGHLYLPEVVIMVMSEVKDENNDVKHIVSEAHGTEPGSRDHFAGGDIGPNGEWWTFTPLPGFANDALKEVAMSHRPQSWPANWPDKMEDDINPGWPSSWNGYFGRDVRNADQESYYVIDDYNNQEFAFYPDETDRSRRGLGVRATCRNFQWSNVLVEDILFILYDIKNIGTYDHPKVNFGNLVGISMGRITTGFGDAEDDCGAYDLDEEMSYSYDFDNKGDGGWEPVGFLGLAFFESPGNPFDGIDNDGDGALKPGPVISEELFNPRTVQEGDTVVIIDYNSYDRSLIPMPETLEIRYRDKTIQITVGQTLTEEANNLIDDNLNGLIDENNGSTFGEGEAAFTRYLYLGLKYVDYISGEGLDNPLIDERRDDGIDNNEDWDPALEDVGLDGILGNNQIGENDNKATSGWQPADVIPGLTGKANKFGLLDTGLPGEPHIDKTDINESDMIGLSAFNLYAPQTEYPLKDDERLWNGLKPGLLDDILTNANVDLMYGSGYFPLKPEQIERFSLGVVLGLTKEELYRNKGYAQTTYLTNYNFAKAPDIPNVSVYSGNKKVILYWDDLAEQSMDPISGKDFEGYRIYRSTDKSWRDALPITDGYGSVKYRDPIAQFDLDNAYAEFAAIPVNGVHFYLGSNTGLVHSFVDTTVQNGTTYYYAVTSYDHGDPAQGIPPTECSKFISVSASGEILKGSNVSVARPEAPVAGFLEAGLDTLRLLQGGTTSGQAVLKMIDPGKILDNHTYQIVFEDSLIEKSQYAYPVTTNFSLLDVTNPDSSIICFGPKIMDMQENLPVINGFQISLQNEAILEWNMDESGWNHRNIYEFSFKNYRDSKNPVILQPGQFRIEFGEPGMDTSTAYVSGNTELPAIPVNFTVINTMTNTGVPFAFLEEDGEAEAPGIFSAFTSGSQRDTDAIILLSDDLVAGWQFTLNRSSATNMRLPKSGDVAEIKLRNPFLSNDVFEFTTRAERTDYELARTELDRIKVVPNPYIAANSWESPNLYASGRGPRELHFIHVPGICIIRIFDIQGNLVKKINRNNPTLSDGTEIWNMLSDDNLDIAYGIYVYHVEAPGIGEKIGKFAVIK